MRLGITSSIAIIGYALFVHGVGSAAAKCTSVQARCAVEIGGVCDPKTGHWQFGWFRGYKVGGNTEAFDACVSRMLAKRK